MGAHFARPKFRLVGLFGDGSLGMSAGDLETISRMNIPAVLIHFNNSTFGWIKALQQLHSKEKYFSVDFNPGNPVMVAEGFGLKALQAKRPEELTEAMGIAFRSNEPVFIDVVTEPEVDSLPPVFSWHRAAENK